MDARTHHLLTAPPLPLLLRMATPNSMAFFIQAAVSLTEVWIVGRLGAAPLAAIALVFPMLMLSQTLANGALGGAVAAAVARALGAGDADRARQLLWHALALAGIGAAILLMLFLLGGVPFLRFLGGSGDVLQMATAYCAILFGGAAFVWLMGAASASFRGMGNMRFPAVMMLVNALVQVPFSATLVLGLFGAPQLGVRGAAISAVTAAAVVSLIMLWRLGFGALPINLRRSACRFTAAGFRDILKVALPAALSPVLTIATILGMTAIVGQFGDKTLAGYGIGSRIEFLMVPLIFGLGAAMTSLVGMSIGAGDGARAERVGWLGGGAATLLTGVVGLTLALWPDLWIPLFTPDPEIAASTRAYIRIVGPCYAFFGLGLALYFASQGAGAMLWPIAATVLRIVLVIGGAPLLGFALGLGLTGVYAAAAVGMVAYGLMIAAAVKQGAWRR